MLKAQPLFYSGSLESEAWVYTEAPAKVVEFEYNSEGLRVQKKVTANGETVVMDYVLHGKQIAEMICGEDKLHFFYDAQNRPSTVNYNGALYTYVHNLQGDVCLLYTSGALIETIPYEYGDSNWKDKLTKYNGKTITYDAIGNPLDDGERQYEWEAGRRLKKVIIKDDSAS